MKAFVTSMRTTVTLLLVLTLLLGFVYPFFVLAVSQLIFHDKANGSLITQNQKIVGSKLLAQEFTQAKYFWSRPAATTPPYNAAASAASNMNPANPELVALIKKRTAMLRRSNEDKRKIPVELVTASGSGLDPHITLAAAEYQLPRVAEARNRKEQEVRALVAKHTQHWLGNDYINVLELNLALDAK